MYIRFQGKRNNDRSDSKLGIFQLAFELRDSGELADYYESELLGHIEWLRMHLKTPDVLKRDGNHRAISWFHPRAKEPINRIRSIKAILEEHGYIIDQVESSEVGRVIYEDGFQVVAKPVRRNA